MKKRKLGATDLDVSCISFGCNVFGWTVDNEEDAFNLLDAFFEAGGNFLDTADVYPAWAPGNKGGISERMIGKWFKKSGKREKTVLITKVGMKGAGYDGGLKGSYIIKSIEDSLRNLQTDYIDLYLSHKDDANTPLEETLSAYGGLIKQGKVRAIGASNYTAPRLLEALRISRELGLPSYQVLETHYNICDRNQYENELEAVCRENELGVISYSSLANGFLTGKYRSEGDAGKSPRGARVVSQYINNRGLRILDALDCIAKLHSSTPASVAIAWILTNASIASSIASATNIAQLHSLIDGTNLTLSVGDIEKLTIASAL